RRVLELKRLQDDRRSALELRSNPLDVCGPRERRRRPGDVLRVVREHDLPALFDDAEPWMTEPAFRDAPLDLRERDQVDEPPLLVAPDEEGFLLPVLTEEALGFYGRDATLEGAATSRCRLNAYRSRPTS